MFYDDFCVTDNQKAVFNAILKLSKGRKYVAIQELNYLRIPQNELEKILRYFEEKGLFENVQHLSENYPVLFLMR